MLYKFSDWVEERDLSEGPLGRLGQGVPAGGRVMGYSDRPMPGRMGLAPRTSMLARQGNQPVPYARQEPSQTVAQEPISNQATTAQFAPDTGRGPSKSVQADWWRFNQAVEKYGFQNPITQRQVDSLRNQGFDVRPGASGKYRLINTNMVQQLGANSPAQTWSRKDLERDMSAREKYNISRRGELAQNPNYGRLRQGRDYQ